MSASLHSWIHLRMRLQNTHCACAWTLRMRIDIAHAHRHCACAWTLRMDIALVHFGIRACARWRLQETKNEP